MTYSIQYDERAADDMKAYDPHIAVRLYRTLEEKLSQAPLHFGEYLTGKLYPYRKLRVGEYRVVYRVYEQKVLVYVIVVGNRRDDEVYEKALQRITMRN